MERLSFRRAMRHALQQKPVPQDAAPPPSIAAPAAPPPPPRGLAGALKSKVRSLGKGVVLRLMGPLRRLLVEHIEARIGNVQALQEGTDAKLHEVIVRLQHLQHSLGQLDRLAAGGQSVADLSRQLAALDAQASRLRTAIDDVAVKVRGPLELADGARAIRVADGYAVVPREEVTLTVMLTDAPGGGGLEPGTRDVLRRILKPGGPSWTSAPISA